MEYCKDFQSSKRGTIIASIGASLGIASLLLYYVPIIGFFIALPLAIVGCITGIAALAFMIYKKKKGIILAIIATLLSITTLMLCGNDLQKVKSDLYKEDVCELFLAALPDSRQWFEIQVSPRNQTMDVLHLFTGDASRVTPTGRLQPDAVARDRWSLREWEASGLRTASGTLLDANAARIGWTVEVAIPSALLTKRLGGGPLRPLDLYANFVRYDHPAAEDGTRSTVFASWSAVESGCPHISPSRLGTLRLTRPEPVR